LQWKIEEDRWNRGWLHQIRGRLLTWEAKVVCFLKIWWRLNEALLNYLEAINIGMESTLMKEMRFDESPNIFCAPRPIQIGATP